MNPLELEARIRTFLTETLRLNVDPLPPDRELVADGDVDSMDVVRLAALLEDLLGIAIPDQDVTDENFGSIARILAYAKARAALSG